MFVSLPVEIVDRYKSLFSCCSHVTLKEITQESAICEHKKKRSGKDRREIWGGAMMF